MAFNRLCRNQSRPHADGPRTRFRRPPQRMIRVGQSSSRWLSQRHFRGWLFRVLGHLASIFLDPFAPPELPGFNATMGPLTPAECCLTLDRSLCLMCLTFRSFRLQPPDAPRRRFHTLPLIATSFRPLLDHHRRRTVWVSPLASRLTVTSGRIEFTCVADQPFASRYSPPRLTATQFRSATSRRAFAWRGLSPL